MDEGKGVTIKRTREYADRHSLLAAAGRPHSDAGQLRLHGASARSDVDVAGGSGRRRVAAAVRVNVRMERRRKRGRMCVCVRARVRVRQSDVRRGQEGLRPNGAETKFVLVALPISVLLLLVRILQREAMVVGRNGLIALELRELTAHEQRHEQQRRTKTTASAVGTQHKDARGVRFIRACFD